MVVNLESFVIFRLFNWQKILCWLLSNNIPSLFSHSSRQPSYIVFFQTLFASMMMSQISKNQKNQIFLKISRFFENNIYGVKFCVWQKKNFVFFYILFYCKRFLAIKSYFLNIVPFLQIKFYLRWILDWKFI
jgi:hypothetical protein